MYSYKQLEPPDYPGVFWLQEALRKRGAFAMEKRNLRGKRKEFCPMRVRSVCNVFSKAIALFRI